MRVVGTSQLVIGLPSAGKTTFLAALWHVAESEEVEGTLRLTQLTGDTEHLNRIRADWLACRDVGRTTSQSEKLVTMVLRDDACSATAAVTFPDMSGESFETQWKDRRCTPEYLELARGASGVILFVHPKHVREGTRIDEADRLIAQLGHGPKLPVELEPNPEEPWSPDRAPTQVKLVDLIQMLVRPPSVSKPRRLALIVSAWDLLGPNPGSPEEWAASRLPLLVQFLDANPKLFDWRAYGISALGGELSRDAETLRGRVRQAERIIVVGSEARLHDITAPVRWLMG